MQIVSNQEKLIALVKKRYHWDISSFEPDKNIKTKTTKKETIKEDKDYKEADKLYKEALAHIKDIISPAFMDIKPNYIKINNTYAKTFFVYAYPNFLEWNWLSPIINWDVKFDMSLFVYPIDSGFIQKYLKKRLTQLYSEKSINADKGLINDPALEAQIQDVEELRWKLTRWEENIFIFLYILLFMQIV